VLDGTLSSQKFQVGANAGQTISVDLNTSARTGNTGQLAIASTSSALDASDFSTFSGTDDGGTLFSVTAGDGDQIDVNLSLSADLFDASTAAGATVDASAADQVFEEVTRQINDQVGNSAYASYEEDSNGDATFELRSTDKLTFASGAAGSPFAGADGGNFDGSGGDATVTDGSLNAASVDTAANANDAILRIDAALENVNNFRSELGAVQNRFESTISNLNNNIENLEASKSRILDADFAAETAKLQKANVLQQAGISVLAQANQSPQQVLSLLQ